MRRKRHAEEKRKLIDGLRLSQVEVSMVLKLTAGKSSESKLYFFFAAFWIVRVFVSSFSATSESLQKAMDGVEHVPNNNLSEP